MTIPADEAENKKIFEKVAEERPNDEIVERLRPHIKDVNELAKGRQEKIKGILLDDMATEIAAASAVDDLGEVIEYHSQSLGIERPKFDGSSVLRDISRLSSVHVFRRYCEEVFEFDSAMVEKLLIAEIERRWFEISRPQADRHERTTLKLPDEVTVLIREIARAMTKRESNVKRETRSVGTESNRTHAKPDGRTTGGDR